MPVIVASAPGKVILFGEHAVVYQRPAIAVPVEQVRAKAYVTARPTALPGEVRIEAPDIRLSALLDELSADDPLAAAIHGLIELSGLRPPACSIRVSSSIPIASGMGSGAAVTVALLRALSAFMGFPITVEQTNHLTFTVEGIHHGTPSGVDNTVISYERPVYFVRGKPIEILKVGKPFTLVIGNTGIQSQTAAVVQDVHRRWEQDQKFFENAFDAVGSLLAAARRAIETGSIQELGPLMAENHVQLQRIGVSSPELDRLVDAALQAGALGAKLSGAGRGGNMIALVNAERASSVADALTKAGAVSTITSVVKAS